MLDKVRVYEIINSSITNKKEREALIRVMDELYATYESGETLKTTGSRRIRKLLRIYRFDRGLDYEGIPSLNEWMDWLLARSGLPVLRGVRQHLASLSQIISRIGVVRLDSNHLISGRDVMSARIYLTNAIEIISEFLNSMDLD